LSLLEDCAFIIARVSRLVNRGFAEGLNHGTHGRATEREPDAEASASVGGSPLKGAVGACLSTLAPAEPVDSSAGHLLCVPCCSVASVIQTLEIGGWAGAPLGPSLWRAVASDCDPIAATHDAL